MKIYLALEGTTDLDFLNEINSWVDKDGKPYEIINGLDHLKRIEKEEDDVVKASLQAKMSEAEFFAIVIADKTKSFRKFTRWQIEYAVNCGKPVVAMNLNGIRSVDFDRCPTFLKKNLAMHITAQNEIFNYALENWPESFKEKNSKEDHKTYRYSNDVYESLGLHTADFA